jgi:hypothetical protein
LYIPPTGSASDDLLLTPFVGKVMFEVVGGVDLPIRVSLTSGADMMGIFSNIEGANWWSRLFYLLISYQMVDQLTQILVY